MGDTQVKTSVWARIPLWVKDLVAGFFLMWLWLAGTWTEIRENGEASFIAFPALLLLYMFYRVGRRLLKGSAYPQRKRVPTPITQSQPQASPIQRSSTDAAPQPQVLEPLFPPPPARASDFTPAAAANTQKRDARVNPSEDPKAPRGHLWLWVLSAAVVVAVVGFLTYVTVHGDSQSDTVDAAKAGKVEAAAVTPAPESSACIDAFATLHSVAEEGQSDIEHAFRELEETRGRHNKAELLVSLTGKLGVLQVQAQTTPTVAELETVEALVVEGLAKTKDSMQQLAAVFEYRTPVPDVVSLYEEGEQLLAAALATASPC